MSTSSQRGGRTGTRIGGGAQTVGADGLLVPPPRGSVIRTIRRGVEISPQIVQGLGWTLLLAVVSTGGRLTVPVAVQQTLDRGISGPGGPDPVLVAQLVGSAVLVVLIAALANYAVNVRLFRATEAGLATLRTTAFRHILDLSALTQATERRGALVSRVTSDVDTISAFVQFGGIILLISLGQMLATTVLMIVYSPLLAAVVWVTVLPLLLGLRPLQRLLSRSYALVRVRVGTMLAGLSEAVVGAETIRAAGVTARSGARVAAAIEDHRRAASRAGVTSASIFSIGTFLSGFALAMVVLAGLVIGPGGGVSLGELLAFLFIVQLFTQPFQVLTEALNEAQNAAAGWQRVISVLDTAKDVVDPGPAGTAVELPRGPISIHVSDVSYRYPGGPLVLTGVSAVIPARSSIAVVGHTGSGKTTLAKLLTRFDDPGEGSVTLNGVDIRRVAFDQLRRRVMFVPQEGFLFDTTIAANIALGRPDATAADVELAVTELGLGPWADSLPHGLQTSAGQRGEALSAGERQLVAVARAYLADPDLLVLDEATSAVDPATEVRLQRALSGLTRGRTTVTIAHRLSTAEAADLVLVMAHGRLVETGTHEQLLTAHGHYAMLHRSWRSELASVT